MWVTLILSVLNKSSCVLFATARAAPHHVSEATEPYMSVNINYKNIANLNQWLDWRRLFHPGGILISLPSHYYTEFLQRSKPYWLTLWKKNTWLWYLFDIFFSYFFKIMSLLSQYLSVLLYDGVGVYSDFVKGFHAHPRYIFESDFVMSPRNMRNYGPSV